MAHLTFSLLIILRLYCPECWFWTAQSKTDVLALQIKISSVSSPEQTLSLLRGASQEALTAEWPELLTVSLLLTKIFWGKLTPSCSQLAQQLKIQVLHLVVTLKCLGQSKVKPSPSRRMKLYFILHFLQPIVLVLFLLFSLYVAVWWIEMLSFLCLQKELYGKNASVW